MLQPGVYVLRADRWVACIRTFSFVGLDFTGATFSSQVRQKPDLSGVPLIDLMTVSTSSAEGVRLIGVTTDTIANHIAAGRIAEVPPGYALTDVVPVSQVGYRINETTMEGLPFPNEIGTDAVNSWDLHVTPAGGTKDKFIGGDFIVRAGTTQ